MFSKRAGFDPTLNALARAVEGRLPTWDLTFSNPTTVDFAFDEAGWSSLRDTLPRPYAPHPRGLDFARRALGEELDWDADRLVLTATTSDAYAFLIKLFCDAGDRVFMPEPSYPLLPMLAQLEATVPLSYPLRFDGQWHIDRAAFVERLDPTVKLILTVSPNNPTGAFLAPDDLDFLLSHGLPVVLDEVFATYDLRHDRSSPLRHTRADSGLLFALGGLSKAAALPQLKLSWIAVSGDASQVERALLQLDLVTDTYLSVNDVTQRALPSLLTSSGERRRLIFERLQQNLDHVGSVLGDAPEVSALPVEGGWYQVLRLPKVQSEEAWVLGFLDRGVLVQPGWFYDFPDEAWVVVSLLTPPKTFLEGMREIVASIVSARAVSR